MLSHLHSCLNSILAGTDSIQQPVPSPDITLQTQNDRISKQRTTQLWDDDDEIVDDDCDDVDVSKEEKEKFARYFRYFVFTGKDLTQYILEYSNNSDLFSRLRRVNRGFCRIVSVKNAWFTHRLMPSRGVADCTQVTRLLMHTYIYGKDIHKKTTRMRRKDKSISDQLFFECATRVWAYENGDVSSHFGEFPTIHEVVMTWCHGLEELSNKLLQLLLQNLGMDEHNLSAKDRQKLRKMFVTYRKKLRQYAVRRISSRDDKMMNAGDDGTYDWRWLDELSTEPNEVTTGDRELPFCMMYYSGSERAIKRKADPLVMMGLLRNRSMSRRLCRLLVDMDRTTPLSDRELKQCRACVNSFACEILLLGQEEDVELIEYFITMGIFQPLHAATNSIVIWEQWALEKEVSWVNSMYGFDMNVDLDRCMQQRLLFAQALLPKLLSQIGQSHALAHVPFHNARERLGMLLGDEDDDFKKALEQIVLRCF